MTDFVVLSRLMVDCELVTGFSKWQVGEFG